ncbi:MAG: hypothetical protein D6732_09700 [Methanobacteriota archaeon]|nr:MAG: hypothetical protein D6732_09700 [Euryarchaeota archaeon]
MLQQDHYDVPFKLYDGNEDSLPWFLKYFQQQREIYLNQGREGNVNAKVLSYFFDGMALLVEADIYFWEQRYQDALDRYQRAIREFKLFRNSRGVKTKLDQLCDAYITRVEGMSFLASGIPITDRNHRHSILSDALLKFNDEIRQVNDLGENLRAFIAYSRALFTEALLWENRAEIEKENSSAEAKKSLMKGRSAIRQAVYINGKMRPTMDKIEDELDDLTRMRILMKAEELGNKGTELSEKGDYQEAKGYFKKAMKFYERAAHLALNANNRRVLLSMSTVMEASVIECDANEFYRKMDDMENSAIKFEEAGKKIDKAIALIGSLGTKELRDSFNAQREFYIAMSILCKAIMLYDKEEYVEAKQLFDQANNHFDESIKLAKMSQTETIEMLAQEAKNDVETYIQLCETFI